MAGRLAFSTGSKKKRNWREMSEDSDEEAAKDDDGDVIDEKALEAELASQEKEEEAERVRLAAIKAEADARKAARQAAWAAKERAIEEKGAAKVRAEEEKLAEENSGGLSLAAYRERRVVVVTNLSYESKEDDVKMLMEGYGRIACIRCNGGAALIEFASDLSAQDALPIEGSKIPGPFLHNRRLDVHLRTNPSAPMPRSKGGGTDKNFGTHLPGSLRQDKSYAPSYQVSDEQNARYDREHAKYGGTGDQRKATTGYGRTQTSGHKNDSYADRDRYDDNRYYKERRSDGRSGDWTNRQRGCRGH